jgi:hypothetical protein
MFTGIESGIPFKEVYASSKGSSATSTRSAVPSGSSEAVEDVNRAAVEAQNERDYRYQYLINIPRTAANFATDVRKRDKNR